MEAMRPISALLLCSSLSLVSQTPKEKALRVAVLPFEGVGPEEAGEVGSALQAMLITDLAATPSLRLVERAQLGDIMAEQQMAVSGAMDTSTIPRLGKLLSASHVLVGRCTIVGSKLRLDSRLVSVEKGTVLLAESTEGDKDAFFELEKALANQLIQKLGVTLAPKERAQVAKIHTADYQAFRAFGRGLRLHDQKLEEKAILALQEAIQKDKDFNLAATTLDEYQRLIASLKNRAESILDAQRQLERAKADEAAGAEAKLVERLQKLAEGPDTAWEDRLTALHSLAVALGNLGSRQNKLYHLRRIEDRFWMKRQAEAAAARYEEEALKVFPVAPLTIDESNYSWSLTENLGEFDKEWAWAKKKLLRVEDIAENQKNMVLSSARYPDLTAELLHFDARQTAAFHQQLFDLCKKLQPDEYHVTEGLEALAKRWRNVLELDKSTALFTELSRRSDNPWRLKGLAQEVETNRDLAAFLSKAPQEGREYLLLNEGNLHAARSVFPDRSVSPRALQELTRLRAWPHQDRFMLIGDLPVWSLGNPNILSTGPRADAHRAAELRYHRPARMSDKDVDALIALGAAPRQSFTLKTRLSFTAPPDFAPRDPIDPGRPEVTFLFAMSDVDCEKREDPATQKAVTTRPMKAYGLILKSDAVQLVRLVESGRDMWNRKGPLHEEVVRSSPEKGEAATQDLVVKMSGVHVVVEVNGRSHRFTLPQPTAGFTGLRVRGYGYVSMGALAIVK
jgi:TolB-like protein